MGSVFAAVASYLQAKSQQGQWLVRIDDLDSLRIVQGVDSDILTTLEAFGLYWDNSVVYQSQCLDQYESALSELKQQQLIYPCSCSRKELSQLQSLDSGSNIYPGICRNQKISLAAAHALRIKVPDIYITFTDLAQGTITENLKQQHGDFILRRKDQIIAYQLAVVIDDANQQITEIVRGADLLDSTVKQIYLQQKLGLNSQQYMHIPILTDKQGNKLSKQTFATAVAIEKAPVILSQVLNLLKQPLPAELNSAPVEQQLKWAIRHWQPTQLKKDRAISQGIA